MEYYTQTVWLFNHLGQRGLPRDPDIITELILTRRYYSKGQFTLGRKWSRKWKFTFPLSHSHYNVFTIPTFCCKTAAVNRNFHLWFRFWASVKAPTVLNQSNFMLRIHFLAQWTLTFTILVWHFILACHLCLGSTLVGGKAEVPPQYDPFFGTGHKKSSSDFQCSYMHISNLMSWMQRNL